jgi:Cof subfamily protein (haloacid dehalogenase superfamily)
VRGRIRLVASDLDGTLLEPPSRRREAAGSGRSFSLGSISERTRAALDRLRDAGVELVAVTGRPPRWVTEIGLGPGLVICSNGALVIDLETGDVVAERALAPDAGAEVLARLRSLHPQGMVAVEYADGVGMEEAWHATIPRALAGERVAPAEELVRRPAAKILMKVPGTEGDAYIDAAAEAVGDIGVVTASGGLQLIEVSAPGVDKATTLARLCAEQDVGAEHVVAFGDARNDLPMLTWAGTGVAMGDAHPTVIGPPTTSPAPAPRTAWPPGWSATSSRPVTSRGPAASGMVRGATGLPRARRLPWNHDSTCPPTSPTPSGGSTPSRRRRGRPSATRPSTCW